MLDNDPRRSSGEGQHVYTAGEVMDALMEGTDDLELAMDVQAAISKLPMPEQLALTLYTAGLTMAAAMEMAGEQGNSTRFLERVQRHLLYYLNGKRGRYD